MHDLHQRLSNWGRWGPDDQLGTLNFVTADVTAAAASLVRSGRTVSCARPLPTQPAPDNMNPVVHHMTGTATEGYGGDYFAITTHGYVTSHIRCPRDIFHEGMMYNGFVRRGHRPWRYQARHPPPADPGSSPAASSSTCLGHEASMPSSRASLIFPEDLERAEEAAGVTVRRGDVLLVRTGRWRWREMHGPWAPNTGMAGLDASRLAWIHDREIAVLGSDGVSDVMPSPVDNVPMPIHTVAIVAMGIHLLDNLDLDQLAEACSAEGRWAFLLTVAPLVLHLGTASPVNPIAVCDRALDYPGRALGVARPHTGSMPWRRISANSASRSGGSGEAHKRSSSAK